MDAWTALAQIVGLLSAATVLGLVAQRLGQHAVIGYLLAGILVGPRALGLVESGAAVQLLAEIGVALLLFTIGLEFSIRRLRALGGRVALFGVLQVLGTVAAAHAVASALGLSTRAALAVALAIALSSTAVVLRLITERSELDSLHGRTALGILLLQDISVIPALVLISILAGAPGRRGPTELLHGLAVGLGLLAAIYLAVRWLLPAVLVRAAGGGTRELPVLLSVTVCLGCSWASHAAGLSPILGAFAAGMLLAESPFAAQVRADVIPLRAAFLTVFFSSIGMLASWPEWSGLLWAVALALAIAVGKAVLIVMLGLAIRTDLATSVRTGIVLAQIGEFSFVLLQTALEDALLEEHVFQSLVTASVMTLLVSPYLIRYAGAVAGLVERVVGRRVKQPPAAPLETRSNHAVVIGWGPAGQRVAQELRARGTAVVVVDLNPKTAASSSATLPIEYGDATQREVLEHAGVRDARAAVVTVPDPGTARLIIGQLRAIAPQLPIVARLRYHIHWESLVQAGAGRVVSEELVVGEMLARDALAELDNLGNTAC